MYYFGHIKLVIFSILISSILADSIIEHIDKHKIKPKQFPQLSFALPALGFLQGQGSRSNIFGKSTVTRTILSTVATITAASFRTCTTSAAALMPCAGKRRRRGVGSGENEIEASPSIKLILGTTEITDPASVAEFLSENPPRVNSEFDMDMNGQEVTTISSLERNLDGTTTILYPSQDEEVSNDGVVLVGDSKDESGVTTETPYSDSFDTTIRPVKDEQDEDFARAGLGGGLVTVTSRIPITHVVQTAATGTTLATLTISYAGCLPPSLPVVGLQCVM